MPRTTMNFWPKRWLRSFAGAALATGVVGGALWAVEPAFEVPEPPKGAVKADPPKLDKPAAPKEKLITFAMSDKPWASVIEWYVAETGLPFIGTEKPPTGTFNFIPPKDRSGEPKKYTLSQVTDVINEGLLAKNFVLIRGEQSFRLWPADTAIEPALVRRVSLEELDGLASKDMVQVVLPLTSLIAEDVVVDVKKMLSKAAEVVALKGQNTLFMIDIAGNLRRVVKDLRASEDTEKGGAEQFSHKCEYVKARDAAGHLKELLRVPEVAPAPAFPGGFGGGGFGQPGGFGGGGPGAAFDFIGGAGRQRGGAAAASGGAPARGKSVNIVADEASNTLFVNAPPDKIGQAKSFLAKYDVSSGPGAQKILVSKPSFETYTVPAGTAEVMAAALKDQYKTSNVVRIQPVSGNQIFVWATAEDHLEIVGHIRNFGKNSSAVTKVLSVGTVDAGEAVTMLKAMFPDPSKGGPYIDKQNNGPGIVVRGKQEQVADVELAIKGSLGDPEGGPGSGKIRVINLKDVSAGNLAEAIQKLMEEMGTNPVKVIGPGANPPAPAPIPKREEEPAPPPRKGPGGPGEAKKLGLGTRDFESSRLIAFGGDIVDPMAPPKKAATGAPVTITAVGDRLIVTSEDPAAVAMVADIVKLLTKPGATGEFRVIRLQSANAVEAARVLSEWFNGPAQPVQQNRNPFGGGGFGGFGAQPAPAPAEKPRVRIVAEQSSNSLLVQASPLDHITIEKMVRSVLDAPSDSKAVMRTYQITLKYAVATDMMDTIEKLFSESTNRAASQSTPGGFGGGFGGFGGFGGGRQQPLDSLGRPKQVALTIAADDRTNTLIINCSATMYEDIKKLVESIDLKAKDSTKVVQLVPVNGVDPKMVQEVLDAMQGRTSTTNQQRGGGGGGFGGGPFGGGGFGGRGGFGGGGFGGGGFGGGGGMGGRGAGGGGGRGTRNNRASLDPGQWPGWPDSPGGRDFFDSRDMDVPQQPLIYDPLATVSEAPCSSSIDAVHTLDPITLVGAIDLRPAPDLLAQAPPGREPGTMDLTVPRGNVDVQALPELGAVIVTANNKADLELVQQIIKQLEEYLKTSGKDAGPKSSILKLEYADAANLVATMNQVFARAGGQTTQQTPPQPAFPFFGQQQQQQQPAQSGSVFLLAIARSNSILILAPKLRLDYYIEEIKKLDKPNGNGLKSFPLKKAAAQQVATLISQFYAQRYPSDTNLIRTTYDTSSNTVFVQASPADLEEIRSLIERIDTSPSASVNDLRIIRLKNAIADELSATVLQALTQGILPQGTGIVQTTTTGAGGGGGAGGAGGLFGGGAFGGGGLFGGAAGGAGAQGGAAATGTGGVALGSARSNTTKTVSLRFMTPGKDGVVESGYLEDVHITPDVRSNTLIVSAPPKTLDLLLAIIKDLDVPSAAKSQINIFKLKKADAVLTANLLQSLFFGGGTQNRTGAAGGGGAGGLLGGGGAGGGAGGILGQTGGTGAATTTRPLLTLTGNPSDGATLIELRISTDDRTNSIIVAGSQNDLDTIGAIIARLEDDSIAERSSHVFKLRNAGAVDVVSALQPFLTNSLAVISTGNQLSSFQEVTRTIVLSADPVTNNLLISATPAAYAAILPLIEQLDAQPLQVSIEVLIAEVQLTNGEEFGIEVGLQSPILFSRSVIPTTGVNFTNATGGSVPAGTTVNSTITQFAGSAFNFTGATAPVSNNPVSPGVVGFQGLSNFGTGRVNSNGVGGFVFSAGSDTLNVLVRALKTQGRIDTIAVPNITTLDNQVGYVAVGQDFPFVSGGQFNTLGGFQPQIDRRQLGTQLRVTPRISPEGRILMRVEPSISSPQDSLIALGNGLFATAFNVQQIQTTVQVDDGETVVLGGLMQKSNQRTENKVPWLGDLPYVGSLFRFRTQTQTKQELLIILKPHVIRNTADSEKLLMAEARKMSWQLRDVDKLFGTVDSLRSKKAICPPDGRPIVSPDAWVQPDSSMPPPIVRPGEPGPIPSIPAIPAIPEVPTGSAPKAAGPVLPTGAMEPAGGVVAPGTSKPAPAEANADMDVEQKETRGWNQKRRTR